MRRKQAGLTFCARTLPARPAWGRVEVQKMGTPVGRLAKDKALKRWLELRSVRDNEHPPKRQRSPLLLYRADGSH